MALRTVTDQTRSYCREGPWAPGGDWHSGGGELALRRAVWSETQSARWEKSCALQVMSVSRKGRWERQWRRSGNVSPGMGLGDSEGGGPGRGGGRTARARRGRLRLRRRGGGDSAAALAKAWAGWGGAGSGGGERARPPAPRGVPGEFTAGARSGPRTGGGEDGKEGAGRARPAAGMYCSALRRACGGRGRSQAWE